jgi:hypothetical protein
MLVVDDSLDMREFVTRSVLEPHGFEALEARMVQIKGHPQPEPVFEVMSLRSQ